MAFFLLTLYVFPVQTYAKPNKAQEAPKKTEPTSPVSPIAPEQRHGQGFQTEPDKNIKADVRVISSPSKDGYDKALFWANIILAGVGLGGIVVASITLCRIHRQAIEMRLQRILMHRTLNAINRQAGLMEAQNKATQERERARLSFIEPDQPIVHPIRFSSDEDGKTSVLLELFVNLINDGETMAYNVRAFGYIYFTPIKGKPTPAPIDDGYDLRVPKHIRKADRENPVKICLCPQGFGPSIGVDAKVWDEVQSEAASLHVAGAVTYDDIFGVEHKTPFHSFWRIVREEQWGEEDRFWTDISPASN